MALFLGFILFVPLIIYQNVILPVYILPSAQHYEKLNVSMPSVHHLNFVLCDRAAPPPGEALPDCEIGYRLLEKIEERAKARGMKEFVDRKGNPRTLVGLVERATLGGAVRDEEKRFDEASTDLFQTGLKVNRLFALMIPSLFLILNLSTVLILWFGGIRIDNGEISLGRTIGLSAK